MRFSPGCGCCQQCEPCIIWSDAFERVALGSDWDVRSGTWIVASGYASTTSSGAMVATSFPNPSGLSAYRVMARVRGSDYGDEIELVGGYVSDAQYISLRLTLGPSAGDTCGKLAIYSGGVRISDELPVAGATPDAWHTLTLIICDPEYGGDTRIHGYVQTASGYTVGVYGDTSATIGLKIGLATGSIGTRVDFDDVTWSENESESDQRCDACPPECQTLEDDFNRADSSDPGSRYTEYLEDWEIDAGTLRLASAPIGYGIIGTAHAGDRRSIETTVRSSSVGKKARVGLGYRQYGYSVTGRYYRYAELTFGDPGTLSINIRDPGGGETQLAQTSVPGAIADRDVVLRLCDTGQYLIAVAHPDTQSAVTISAQPPYPTYAGDSVLTADSTEIRFKRLVLCSLPTCQTCSQHQTCYLSSYAGAGCEWTEPSGNWDDTPSTSDSGAKLIDTADYYVPAGAVLNACVTIANSGDVAKFFLPWTDANNYAAIVITAAAADGCGSVAIEENVAGSLTTLKTHPFWSVKTGQKICVQACAANGRLKAIVTAPSGRYLQIGSPVTVPDTMHYGIGTGTVTGLVTFDQISLQHHQAPDRPCPSCFKCTIHDQPAGDCEYDGTGVVPRSHPDDDTSGIVAGALQFDADNQTGRVQSGQDYLEITHPASGNATAKVNGSSFVLTREELGSYGFTFCYGRGSATAKISGSVFSASSLGGATTIQQSGDGRLNLAEWMYDRCGSCAHCLCDAAPGYRVIIDGLTPYECQGSAPCEDCPEFDGTYVLDFAGSVIVNESFGWANCSYTSAPMYGPCPWDTEQNAGVGMVIGDRAIPDSNPFVRYPGVLVQVLLRNSVLYGNEWIEIALGPWAPDYTRFDCRDFGSVDVPFYRHVGSFPPSCDTKKVRCTLEEL